MNIAFRVDASSMIGTGHVIRCITLAKVLSQNGATCSFFCRNHRGNLIGTVRSSGFKCFELRCVDSAVENNEPSDDYASWLGDSWENDAAETIKLLWSLGGNFDWVVVDHYALDHRWEQKVQEFSKKIMVIDDLLDRRHVCHLLFSQVPDVLIESVARLVPEDCLKLIGPKFALLSPNYISARKGLGARSALINRVLIYFGGGLDALPLICETISALSSPQLSTIHLDVVVGGLTVHQELSDLIESRGNVTVYGQLSDLVELMMSADLAIGAAGASSWERCCLALPSILVVAAPNQLQIAAGLAERKAAVVINEQDKIRELIAKNVLKLMSDQALYREISENAMNVCDGRGVYLVAGCMLCSEDVEL